MQSKNQIKTCNMIKYQMGPNQQNRLKIIIAKFKLQKQLKLRFTRVQKTNF